MITQIQDQIAATIKEAAGVSVEVTCRGSDEWTVSGSLNDTLVAANYLYTHNLMTTTDSTYDEELQENYIYMKAVHYRPHAGKEQTK